MLARGFYRRRTLVVARGLVGKVLIVEGPGGKRLSGRIVETEAYLGKEDRASHASRKNPLRARIMWEAPGTAYVYMVYGMHYCFNVVTGPMGSPGAVLVRGLVPMEGISVMEVNRGRACARRGFTDGPGKLCKALGIGREMNGADVCSGPVTVEDDSYRVAGILSLPRIGVDYAGECAKRPYRFMDRAVADGKIPT